MIEHVSALGHRNVFAMHRTTLMFTREDYLTPRGDCILAIQATKGCADLSENFKEKLRRKEAKLEVTVECGGLRDKITAYGHPDLPLSHATDMVVRKSRFTCERTLAISADKAACDLDRKLIERIKEGREVLITLEVI